MITQWRLSDFKSVAAIQPLVFRKITVFAGPNSSGKSTVLQSILLIAQTLASKVSRRHLVLNGEMVRLGTFDDVVHERSDTIKIGFTFSVSSDSLRSAGYTNRYLLYAQFVSTQEVSNYEYSVDATFGRSEQRSLDTEKPRQLQAELIRGEFSAKPQRATQMQLEESSSRNETILTIVPRSQQEIEHARSIWSSAVLAGRSAVDMEDLRYQVRLSPAGTERRRRFRRYTSEFGGNSEPVAVGLEHFLPTSLVSKFEIGPRLFETALTAIAESTMSSSEKIVTSWEASKENPIFTEFAKVIKSLAVSKQIPLTEYLRKLRIFMASPTRTIEDSTNVPEVYRAVRERVGPEIFSQNALEYVPPPEPIALLNAAVNMKFSQIRYLGPLRDEPKPVYSIANSADPADVGPKGQFTAAVLDLYAEHKVDFIPPSNPEATPVKVELQVAVRAWMNHFGLAESFRTTEEGKLGHRLLIRPGGIKKDVDLTNVGVGVSQVLPIIVMSLISAPDSVLLFEQPEFHVHPGVQSLLADFFLAVMKTGRQCIIETHSEYLINRLRLRSAQSPLQTPLHDDIMFYFVERRGPASTFKTVPMNEFGAIPDWPEGFFDQGPDEAERILQAGRVKRHVIDEMRFRRRESRGRDDLPS